jgi:hypothetical protein
VRPIPQSALVCNLFASVLSSLVDLSPRSFSSSLVSVTQLSRCKFEKEAAQCDLNDKNGRRLAANSGPEEEKGMTSKMSMRRME